MQQIMKYHTIGLMSGTSLDGLDIAYCIFTIANNKWSFQIKETTTIPYPTSFIDQLAKCTQLSGLELSVLDIDLGKWMGTQAHQFIKQHHLKIDIIASHGHTIFHQPEKGLTLQIGSGPEILNASGITVVNDFRSKDVSLGGNGAPLVPIGDQLLFGEYENCLNLGGIANISYQQNEKRIAYDIVPMNMVLNHLANKLGKPYDNHGKMARIGSVNNTILQKLNALSFYKKNPPKSLGYEWVEDSIFPILESSNINNQDQLASFVDHIATQLASHLPKGKTLVTGGGAYNDFLIECINQKIAETQTLVIPNQTILEFKEAMIFGFLGVLRIRNEINCLRSATGASRDSSGGMVYYK